MRILLIGHGRMGRLIEQTALAAGDQIAGVVGLDNTGSWTPWAGWPTWPWTSPPPPSCPRLAAYVRRTGTPLLSGTTGIPAEGMAAFTDLGRYAPVLHSANFSVGVAVFRRVLEEISGVLRPDFDIEIVETHHNQKADAPSGTAKLLLEAIDPRGELTPVYGRQGMCGRRDPREIGVHALRGGTEAGTHTVSFFGPDEVLEITHRAASRQIFVNGALHMARKLCRMPKGRYELQDILFGGQNP